MKNIDRLKNTEDVREVAIAVMNTIYKYIDFDNTESEDSNDSNQQSDDASDSDGESPDENVRICELLRQQFHHDQVIAVAPSQTLEQTYNRIGIETIDLHRTIVTTIENLILRPTTYHTLVETFESFSVEEVVILNEAVDGLQVKDIPLHKDGALMLVKRKDELYVPHSDTHLRLGDLVIALGTETALEQIRGELS